MMWSSQMFPSWCTYLAFRRLYTSWQVSSLRVPRRRDRIERSTTKQWHDLASFEIQYSRIMKVCGGSSTRSVSRVMPNQEIMTPTRHGNHVLTAPRFFVPSSHQTVANDSFWPSLRCYTMGTAKKKKGHEVVNRGCLSAGHHAFRRNLTSELNLGKQTTVCVVNHLQTH